MNVVAHNLTAMNAQRQFKINTGEKKKTVEKLSSGYRINRAADDAAGLAISEKMRWQVRGLTRASKNIEEGISFVQTAEGALQEIHDICQRARELCVQAANDTNTDADRQHIQDEIDQLAEETGHITKFTHFNTQFIWDVPYLPDFEGNAMQAKFWAKSVDDVTGNATYGGINWADKRYTWDEAGLSGIYDEATGLFKEGTYTASFQAGTLNADDTFTDAGTATFDVIVPADSAEPNLIFRREWSADETGITLDGIKYDWSDLEDINHEKGNFDTSNIRPGTTWGINDLNDEHVWFTIDDDDNNLNDVIKGINGDAIGELIWETRARGAEKRSAVSALYLGDGDGNLNDNTFKIDSSNYQYVSTSYKLSANNAGLTVTSSNGLNLGTESWEDLDLFDDPDSNFDIKHVYTDHSVYDNTVDDNHQGANSGVNHRTVGAQDGDPGYNSTAKDPVTGDSFINIQMTLAEEASKDEVLEALNGSSTFYSQTPIATQQLSFSQTGDTSSHISLDTTASRKTGDMGFYNQRALGSTFSQGTTFNDNGQILVNENNMSFRMSGTDTMPGTSGTNTYSLSANKTVSAIKAEIRNAIDKKDSSGEPLNTQDTDVSLSFSGSGYGSFELHFDVDGITTAENDAIKAQANQEADDEVNPLAAAYAENLVVEETKAQLYGEAREWLCDTVAKETIRSEAEAAITNQIEQEARNAANTAVNNETERLISEAATTTVDGQLDAKKTAAETLGASEGTSAANNYINTTYGIMPAGGDEASLRAVAEQLLQNEAGYDGMTESERTAWVDNKYADLRTEWDSAYQTKYDEIYATDYTAYFNDRDNLINAENIRIHNSTAEYNSFRNTAYASKYTSTHDDYVDNHYSTDQKNSMIEAKYTEMLYRNGNSSQGYSDRYNTLHNDTEAGTPTTASGLGSSPLHKRLRTKYEELIEPSSSTYTNTYNAHKAADYEQYRQNYITANKPAIYRRHYNDDYNAKLTELTNAAFDELVNSTKVTYKDDTARFTINERSILTASTGTAPHSTFKTDVKYYRSLKIQSGALPLQPIDIKYRALNKGIIGLNKIDVSSYTKAGRGIAICDEAIDLISTERASFGAYQNRLEHAMAINDNTAENTQAAESRIRDADMAKESVKNAKHDILLRAGEAMIAQANQSTNGILTLLQ